MPATRPGSGGRVHRRRHSRRAVDRLLSWRWAFFINVPVAVAVLIIAPAVLAESRPTTKQRLDVPGAICVLVFVTETSLVFLLTLYLQQVLGYTPLGAGLSFAVLGLGTVLGGILGPKVIGKIGNKKAIV